MRFAACYTALTIYVDSFGARVGDKLIGNLAAAVGYALRWLAFLVAFLLKRGPYIVGLWLIIHGITLYDVRLGFIASGIAILIAFWPQTREVPK